MQRPNGYDALRHDAALIDRTGSRGRILIAGNDRVPYLHALLTNDIAALRAGAGCYAAYLTPQGRMIADAIVLNLGDLLLVDLDRSVKDEVLQRLDQLVFTEDVRLGDITDAWGELQVAGPSAVRILVATLGASDIGAGETARSEAPDASWKEFDNGRVAWAGTTVVLARTLELGVDAFRLYVERDRLDTLRAGLLAAGAEEASSDAAEVMRVENGRPAFPADMDGDTIPLEAGIEDRAISFTKGCYPGQEVIIRVVSRGHGRVARRLVGLRLEGDQPAAPGDAVVAGDREIGRVRSSVVSPAVGSAIALAYVHRDFVQTGTELTVVVGGARLRGTVVERPFIT